jgi:Transposase/Transposase IS116/IS110/IS902 family
MTHVLHEAFAACVGSDWAEAQHDGCLQAAGSATREGLTLEPPPKAIEAWVTPLRTRFTGPPMAICLARTKGPVVSAWRQEDFLVLFPLNPLTLARYRDACTPSRATDAPTDAALPRALLRTYRDTLQPLQPQSPTMRALEQLVAPRRRLVDDTGRITTRLTRTLKHSFPHVLPWFQDKAPRMFGDFLRHWPTRKAVQRARRSPLETCVHDHHGRSADVLAQRIHAITTATPLPTNAGVIAPNAFRVQALVNQLRGTLEALETFAHASAPRAQCHPDFPLCHARPGAGPVCAPRLLVACGKPRDRSACAAARQKYAGIAPGTERRGKKSWGHWRLQGPKFLRPTVVAWAAASIRPAFWARVSSQPQRDQGKAHQAAVRALACQWIRILWRGWQERTSDEESVYLQALNSRGSSLIHHLAKET